VASIEFTDCALQPARSHVDLPYNNTACAGHEIRTNDLLEVSAEKRNNLIQNSLERAETTTLFQFSHKIIIK